MVGALNSRVGGDAQVALLVLAAVEPEVGEHLTTLAVQQAVLPPTDARNSPRLRVLLLLRARLKVGQQQGQVVNSELNREQFNEVRQPHSKRSGVRLFPPQSWTESRSREMPLFSFQNYRNNSWSSPRSDVFDFGFSKGSDNK